MDVGGTLARLPWRLLDTGEGEGAWNMAVDEAILGGMVVRIGDEKFDSSVATRLKALGGAFAERASQEIHSGKSYVMAG